VLHTADFTLKWPRGLFLAEAQVLLWDHTDPPWVERAELLLEEAFAGPVARDALHANIVAGPWEPGPRGVIEALVEQAAQLCPAPEPRPYWSKRKGAPAPAVSVEETMDGFVRLVDDLERRGYCERVVPGSCTDGHGGYFSEYASDQLENHLGVADLWPLGTSRPRWDEDLFFDLIEVLHDLVARPRSRTLHDNCGWHYSNFAFEPARRLYRWQINRLLGHSAVALRLAEEGEDTGRLVAVTDDARAELVSRVAERVDAAGDRVRHALAQFRARAAGEHDKRSAIVTLAGVLEERRHVLKQQLTRKDEAALFLIANRFGLRHQRADQLTDYDAVFLDWVFWWYLATIELSDRLIERTDATPS
jgi:hypothetical protein